MMELCLVYARISMLILCTLYRVSGETPSMDTTEIHMNISVGKTVILPCMIRGITRDNDYMVIWNSPSRRPISYNTRILVGRRFEIVQPYHTEWNLKISPSQPGDSGEYLCQLNTDPLQQKSVHLSVQVPPRISSSKDIEIIEGRQLIIYCNMTGRPRPTITWYKDDVFLPSFTDEILQMERVSRFNAGLYKCVASNGKDSDKAEINVHVLYPPEVSVRSERIGQLQRKKAVLECHSSAFPQGQIQWRKGNKVIAKSTWQYEVQVFDGKRPNERTLNLMIRSLDSTDFGEYVCEAKNDVGTDTVSMYLYEVTTVSPLLEKTTRYPVTEPVYNTRKPVYTTQARYPNTPESPKNGKYTNQGSTAVMVVVSDKSSKNTSSSRHHCVVYNIIIPGLAILMHSFVFDTL